MSTKRESQRIAIVDLLASARAVTEAEASQVRGGIAIYGADGPDDGGCCPLPPLPLPPRGRYPGRDWKFAFPKP